MLSALTDPTYPVGSGDGILDQIYWCLKPELWAELKWDWEGLELYAKGIKEVFDVFSMRMT